MACHLRALLVGPSIPLLAAPNMGLPADMVKLEHAHTHPHILQTSSRRARRSRRCKRAGLRSWRGRWPRQSASTRRLRLVPRSVYGGNSTNALLLVGMARAGCARRAACARHGRLLAALVAALQGCRTRRTSPHPKPQAPLPSLAAPGARAWQDVGGRLWPRGPPAPQKGQGLSAAPRARVPGAVQTPRHALIACLCSGGQGQGELGAGTPARLLGSTPPWARDQGSEQPPAAPHTRTGARPWVRAGPRPQPNKPMPAHPVRRRSWASWMRCRTKWSPSSPRSRSLRRCWTRGRLQRGAWWPCRLWLGRWAWVGMGGLGQQRGGGYASGYVETWVGSHCTSEDRAWWLCRLWLGRWAWVGLVSSAGIGRGGDRREERGAHAAAFASGLLC